MYEFRCTENGIYYFDPVIRGERFASNTLLFLIRDLFSLSLTFLSQSTMVFLFSC